MHVLLKVRRRAVRSGRRAPQAAPGLESLRSRSEGREAPEEAARPPARPQQEAAEARGAARVPGLRTRRPGPTARTSPGLGRARGGGEARRSSGSRGRVASRSGSSRRRPRQPAAPPRSVPGCARRRSSPPWRQWRAAERTRGPRPPPRRVNPFAAPAARRSAAALEVPTHPPPAPLAVRGPASSSRGVSATEARLLPEQARLESNHYIQEESLRGGGAATVLVGGKETRKKENQLIRLPGFEGHWASSPPATNLPSQHPLVDGAVVCWFPSKDPNQRQEV